jgi:peptidoglycan/xylan/chitin deacetylase (PgdA/CDA1 family)
MKNHQRLIILAYHRVLAMPDEIAPDQTDVVQFHRHINVLSKLFNVLTVSDAVRRMKTGTLPPRAVAITFDDGYRDNFTVALPALQRYGLPATFYVATGFTDGGLMWNDAIIESIRQYSDSMFDGTPWGIGMLPTANIDERRAAIATLISKLKYRSRATRESQAIEIADATGATLPRDLMMCRSDIKGLSDAGMELGAHTVNHPILSKTAPDEARSEIATSREHLEELTGAGITTFAYPNGRPDEDFTRDHAAMVKECGFENAVSTSRAVADVTSDPYELPRIGVWDRSSAKVALRLLLLNFGIGQ